MNWQRLHTVEYELHVYIYYVIKVVGGWGLQKSSLDDRVGGWVGKPGKSVYVIYARPLTNYVSFKSYKIENSYAYTIHTPTYHILTITNILLISYPYSHYN